MVEKKRRGRGSDQRCYSGDGGGNAETHIVVLSSLHLKPREQQIEIRIHEILVRHHGGSGPLADRLERRRRGRRSRPPR